jgi:hypothetical protein
VLAKKFLINSFWQKKIDPFWRFLARFFCSPEKAEELLLAALALHFRRRGVGRSRGRGPAWGRGASIFLGGGDQFQPEISGYLIDPFFGVFRQKSFITVFAQNN